MRKNLGSKIKIKTLLVLIAVCMQEWWDAEERIISPIPCSPHHSPPNWSRFCRVKSNLNHVLPHCRIAPAGKGGPAHSLSLPSPYSISRFLSASPLAAVCLVLLPSINHRFSEAVNCQPEERSSIYCFIFSKVSFPWEGEINLTEAVNSSSILSHLTAALGWLALLHSCFVTGWDLCTRTICCGLPFVSFPI